MLQISELNKASVLRAWVCEFESNRLVGRFQLTMVMTHDIATSGDLNLAC